MPRLQIRWTGGRMGQSRRSGLIDRSCPLSLEREIPDEVYYTLKGKSGTPNHASGYSLVCTMLYLQINR